MGETIQADIERKGSMGRRRNGSSNGRGEVHPLPPTNSTTGTMYGSPGIPDTVKLLPPPGLMSTRRRRSCPWLVPLFVVINVVMFIITMYVNNCPQISTGITCVAGFLGRFSFQPMSENPLLGPSSSTLVKMGALDTSKVTNGQGWRLFSCMWLHAGVFHLLVNMLSLLFIGMRMEREFGSLRIAIVYLLSGFGGSLLSALFIQNTISVGASGALFGLLGAMLSELITNWTIYENKVATLISLLVVIALNLVVGMLPHVDNFAHIGGFLSGFLLGFVFLMRPQFGWINQSKIPPGYESDPIVSSKHNAYQRILWIIAFTILVVGFIVAVVMVFRGYDANEHCSWCHYLDCIPSSKWSCGDSVSCQYMVDNSTLTMTCIGKNATSSFPGITNPSTSQVTQFCIQVCS